MTHDRSQGDNISATPVILRLVLLLIASFLSILLLVSLFVLWRAVPSRSLVPRSTSVSDDARSILERRKRREAAAEVAKSEHLARARAAIGPYVHSLAAGNRERLAEIVSMMEHTPGKAVIFDVKGSRVYFASSSPLARQFELIDPKYDLKDIVSFLKEQGFYVMVRFIAVKDDGLATAHPSTQIFHPRTRVSVGSSWVDPSNRSVLLYNSQILREVVRAGVDEVNFDYIRYPTEYALDDVGLTPQDKATKVEDFLKMARRLVNQEGGTTLIGISTYAILGWDYALNMPQLGQDFVRFAPLVDIISPMAYPASFGEGFSAPRGQSRMYYLVLKTLTGYAELLGSEQAKKLRPWIQGYSLDERDFEEQIRAVYDAGSCGFTVWNPGSRYTALARVLPHLAVPSSCQP